MKNRNIILTDNPEDTAPEAESRISPCRIDGPFEEGRTCGGKGGGAKSFGGKSDGGKTFGGKAPGGKGGGGKGPGSKSIGGKGAGAKGV